MPILSVDICEYDIGAEQYGIDGRLKRAILFSPVKASLGSRGLAKIKAKASPAHKIFVGNMFKRNWFIFAISARPLKGDGL